MIVTRFIFNSPIGKLQITATAHFIQSILFMSKINDAEGLEMEHNSTHPLIKNCCAQMQEYFNGNRTCFHLPHKQEGTEFQQSVWMELSKIGYGKTISYLTLSKRLGNVKAIRAAGTANGKNKISIIVPCHRVIGSDGSLTGYAGELWRKKWLLNHEATFANGLQTLF